MPQQTNIRFYTSNPCQIGIPVYLTSIFSITFSEEAINLRSCVLSSFNKSVNVSKHYQILPGIPVSLTCLLVSPSSFTVSSTLYNRCTSLLNYCIQVFEQNVLRTQASTRVNKNQINIKPSISLL